MQFARQVDKPGGDVRTPRPPRMRPRPRSSRDANPRSTNFSTWRTSAHSSSSWERRASSGRRIHAGPWAPWWASTARCAWRTTGRWNRCFPTHVVVDAWRARCCADLPCYGLHRPRMALPQAAAGKGGPTVWTFAAQLPGDRVCQLAEVLKGTQLDTWHEVCAAACVPCGPRYRCVRVPGVPWVCVGAAWPESCRTVRAGSHTHHVGRAGAAGGGESHSRAGRSGGS